jgi:hydrogenase expression/formation protein HypD
MKFVDEYRDPAAARLLAGAIKKLASKSWTIMEVCGGQTHAIVKYGVDELLPSAVTLVHGPGCPVCVTPVELIEKALEIASRPEVIFCSFGDMLRVPGTTFDLLSVKARGGDIRIVYSPLDAVRIARDNPTREIVFFAVGFETTAPANAMAVVQAHHEKLRNFSLLVSHVRVPPAMDAILSSPLNHVQGFLAAGHVCTVMGYTEYEPLARRFRVPIVVTGFEPMDLLHGIYLCLQQLEEGRHEVENPYSRCVQRSGNTAAVDLIERVFRFVPRKWRGIGEIPESGLGLRPEYAAYDAEQRFPTTTGPINESSECLSGLVLQGVKKPHECPAFGESCTPEHPLGATMVSSEGACAAYYRYRRVRVCSTAEPSARSDR